MSHNLLAIFVILAAMSVTYLSYRAFRIWSNGNVSKQNLWLFCILLIVCLIGGGSIFLLHWEGYNSMVYRGTMVEE